MAESSNEKKNKTKSFWIRLASTIVLIAGGSTAIYLGGWVLALVLTAVSIGGVFELFRVFQIHKTPFAPVTYVAVVAYNVLLYAQWMEYVFLLMIAYLLSLLVVYVFAFPKYNSGQLISSFFPFFYVAVCLGYMEQLRQLPHGILLTLLVMVCTCGNDIFAYLVGILIGKHKMFPNLSPKKSVEGFIGGIVGAILCGLGYGFLFRHVVGAGEHNYPAVFAIICGVGALPAVVGDLAASAIKRNHNIKDYSNLIPGHGGIMDRFDSMIFTAPIIYYLVLYLLQAYI